MVNETRQAPPAREQDVAAVEAAVGCRLPDAHRARLLAENGFVIDDTNGPTGRAWTMLPVLDRTSRQTMTRTADDIVRATTSARAIDRIATPGFGEPKPGTPFPADAVVIGHGWRPEERLVLLPAADDPSTLGTALYRQMQLSPIAPLGLDLADLAPSAADLAALVDVALPSFRYHPDPLATGAIRPSPNVCSVCAKPRGYQYTASREIVCPWCIADGSAAEHDWRFIDTGSLAVAADIAAELELRTPGFSTWQDLDWPACCDDATAYVGQLDGDGVASLEAVARDTAGIDDDLLAELIALGEPAQDPAVFGFRCLHCARVHAVLDYS